MDKYGLVLAGGGAKGIYQLGAWQAIRELGIEFSVVVGVSIGSINGALIASDSFDAAKQLWEDASLEKGVSMAQDLRDHDKLFCLRNLPVIIREIKKNGGIDASPTKDFLEKFIDEKKVRSSGIDFGLITFSLTDYEPKEVFLKDIPEGKLIDYLLASSKVPGVSKIGPDDDKYLDGGIYDNTPVELLFKNGYNRMIVIDISNMKGVARKGNYNNSQIIYIRPNDVEDLGAAFDFSDEMYERRFNMGYLDARKAFGLVSGRLFCFGKDVFREMVRKYGADACEELEEMGLELGMEKVRVYTETDFLKELKDTYIRHLEEYNSRREEAEDRPIYGHIVKFLPLFRSGEDYSKAIAVLEGFGE